MWLMAGFLEWISHTSLMFWENRKPITWAQAIALYGSVYASYELVEWGQAGDGPLVGSEMGLFLIFGAVALLLIVSGPRLGPVSDFGPCVVRLISAALVLGSAAICLNGFLGWDMFFPPLPRQLGYHKGTLCLVSGLLASVLLAVYTVRQQDEGARTPWGELLSVAAGLAVLTSILLYWCVIPHSLDA